MMQHNQSQNMNQMNQMNQMQNQTPTNNNSFNFSINPSQMLQGLNAMTSLVNTANSIKSKLDPPNRPAPVPNQNTALPNPLIPQ
jgi:hypothetical protein